MTSDEFRERLAAASTGERRALREVVDALSRLRLPRFAEAAFSAAEQEDLRAETIAKLLADGGARLLAESQPFAFFRTALANAAKDALRRRVRSEAVGESDRAAIVHAAPAQSVERRLEAAARLAHAFEQLTEGERVVALLAHAPERLTNDEWATIAARHPPPPPERPRDPLSRDELAGLLHPTKPAAQAYEAASKALQRAVNKLRRSAGEEES